MWVPPKSSPTILFDVRSVKQVIAAASVNLRWHSAQTNSLCYKELLTFPKIRPSLILRFDMSEMDDCHTHEIQEKRDGIVFGFD